MRNFILICLNFCFFIMLFGIMKDYKFIEINWILNLFLFRLFILLFKYYYIFFFFRGRKLWT